MTAGYVDELAISKPRGNPEWSWALWPLVTLGWFMVVLHLLTKTGFLKWNARAALHGLHTHTHIYILLFKSYQSTLQIQSYTHTHSCSASIHRIHKLPVQPSGQFGGSVPCPRTLQHADRKSREAKHQPLHWSHSLKWWAMWSEIKLE